MRKGWCGSAGKAGARTVRGLAALAIVGLTVFSAGACVGEGGPVLIVEDVTRARVLYRGAVEPGGVLVLSYVHSSEHVPVRGTFVVEASGWLIAKETAFAGFGPGLPEPKAGDAWRREDGMIVVPSAGERLQDLRIRVAPFTRHRLRTPSGEDVDLSALMGDGGAVLIRVGRRQGAHAGETAMPRRR